MFSRSLSSADLVALCRAQRHSLGAGLTLVHVLRQQAERGPRGVRPLAARLLPALEAGSGLGEALDHETGVLPPLFISMAKLGEETGHLPEVLGELEQYYQLELSLRRQVRSQSFLPVAQFVFAVLLIAGLIFVLGLLAGTGRPLLTIFGLGGAAGALAFLGIVGGTLGGLALGWLVLSRWRRQRAAADRFLLRLPVLGW